MATLTISMSGATVTANNGTMTFNINDTDLTSLVAWASATYSPISAPGVTTTPLQNAAALQAWIKGMLINPTIRAVQLYNTPAPPPPIGLS